MRCSVKLDIDSDGYHMCLLFLILDLHKSEVGPSNIYIYIYIDIYIYIFFFFSPSNFFFQIFFSIFFFKFFFQIFFSFKNHFFIKNN